MKKIRALITLITLITFPLISFAYSATDDFDSYSNNDDISGKNGGSGWTSNWQAGTGDGTVVNTVSDSSPNSLAVVANPTRSFTQIQDGTLCFAFNDVSGPSNTVLIRFTNSGNNTIQINLDGSGNLTYYNGSTFVSWGTYSSNAWHTVCVQIDQTNHPYEAQYNIDGGSYSGYSSRSDSTQTSVDGIVTFGTSGLYYDSISVNGTAATPPPPSVDGSGTINRLPKFTATSTISDSLFSDDGTNISLTSGNLFMAINAVIDTLTSGTLNIGTMFANLINIGNASSTINLHGPVTYNSISSASNCSSSTSPADCGSAPAGSVALPNGGDTLTVDTSKVTANSQIFITEDSSLGTRLGVTCNTTVGRTYSVNARTSGTSFTIKSSSDPGTDYSCLSYFIVN